MGIILYIIYSSIGRYIYTYTVGVSVARRSRARRPAQALYAIIEYYTSLSVLLHGGKRRTPRT